MKKMKIAVTGGIGSGKSLALRCIAQMGYPVFSCDEIYKKVIQSPAYIEQIALIFPNVIVDGQIARERLAKLVFEDSANREKINNIAHPIIMKKLYEQMNQCESDLVFAEVPLLFECNYEKEFDKIIYIYRDKATRISNVMLRDGLSDFEIEKRIVAQFNPDTPEGKTRLNESGAILVKNNDTPEDLYKKLLKLIARMKH